MIKRLLRFIGRTLFGDLVFILLLLPLFVGYEMRNDPDVRLPVDAFVTAVVTDYMYDHLPNLEFPPTEDYLDPSQPGAMYWGVSSNSNWLERKTVELLPYYVDNGIATNVISPPIVVFAPQLGLDAFHLGGFTVCDPRDPQYGLVVLNIRYATPGDQWHTDSDALAVLAHELGHLQGACGDAPDVESATQVQMYEVLASAFNHGDKSALRPLMLELRGASMAYLRWWSYGNNLAPEYEWFDSTFIHSNAAEQARKFAYWSDVPSDWGTVLDKYGAVPFFYTWEALNSKNNWTRLLPLGMGIANAPDSSLAKLPSVMRQFRMDDLNYVLSHLFESLFLEQRHV